MLKLWSLITKNGSTTLILIACFLLTFSLNANANEILLSWEVNGDSEVDGYEIHCGNQSGNYTKTIVIDNNAIALDNNKIEYIIDGLEPGKDYFCVVNSFSGINYSKPSEEIKVTTQPDLLQEDNEPNFHTTVLLENETSSQSQIPIIERGEAEIDHTWTRITFKGSFTEPVVVTKPRNYNEENPLIVNIRNIDATGFEMQIQEQGNLEGKHALEKVDYLAIERGTYTLQDGTRFEADQQEVGAGITSITFPFLQGYQTAPIVIASINTHSSETPQAFYLQGIDTVGFQADFQGEETPHLQESNDITFSYVAWEPSSGASNGIAFDYPLLGFATDN